MSKIHIPIIQNDYDIIHNPDVKTKYPNLYQEVADHDKAAASSWYDPSAITFLKYNQHIEDYEKNTKNK